LAKGLPCPRSDVPVACTEIEEALRRINALAGFYDQMDRSIAAVSRGRLGSPRGDAGGDRRTLQETVLVRCVSIIEALFQDLGTRLVDERLDQIPSDPQLRRLVAHLRQQRLARLSSGSWEELVKLWRDGLGVDLNTTFPRQAALAGLRTTRHAIVHRLGAVTEQYRKQHRQRLEALGFNLSGAAVIPLSDADVRDGLELCRACVRWLHASL
jgi:hypothetical protein